MEQRILPKKYRLKEDYRRTNKGIEKIIPQGTTVVAIQEIIHYQKRTHRVQVQHDELIVWVHFKDLSVLR